MQKAHDLVLSAQSWDLWLCHIVELTLNYMWAENTQSTGFSWNCSMYNCALCFSKAAIMSLGQMHKTENTLYQRKQGQLIQQLLCYHTSCHMTMLKMVFPINCSWVRGKNSTVSTKSYILNVERGSLCTHGEWVDPHTLWLRSSISPILQTVNSIVTWTKIPQKGYLNSSSNHLSIAIADCTCLSSLCWGQPLSTSSINSNSKMQTGMRPAEVTPPCLKIKDQEGCRYLFKHDVIGVLTIMPHTKFSPVPNTNIQEQVQKVAQAQWPLKRHNFC